MNIGHRRVVFGYHAGRAGLDAHGGTGDPVGLDDIRTSAYTHVGVPMHHSGSYVNGLVDAGVRIIRTMEGRWNPGLNQTDLGKVILDWINIQRPGPFLLTWLNNIWGPCHGFAWNMEHNILTPDKYPVTDADRELAKLWKLDVSQERHLIALRCRQFATIIRLMKKLGTKRWGEFMVIAYCEYGAGNARTRYGCDWSMLANPFLKLGRMTLPLIDYAQCNYFGSERLTHEYVRWAMRFPRPILHNIQLPVPLNNPEGYAAQAMDRFIRLMALRPDDGFASCDARNPEDITHVWGDADRDVAYAIAEALKPATGKHTTAITPSSWGRVKKSAG